MDFRRHHITPGSPTHLTQVLYVTAYMLFNTHDMHNMHAVQLYICLSAQLAVFVHNLQQWCNAFICYQKKAACSLLFDVFPSWQSLLAVCFILQPPPLFSSHTPLCVCLMPFPLRHGTGQPLRSGEVFRSQTPCEKALLPPVQKQISGLPCWDQVYVSVSPPASMCVV